MRSGPGVARTILLFHTISARPSKQPRMVGSTLGVYSFGLFFVSARTNKRHHHRGARTLVPGVTSPCLTYMLSCNFEAVVTNASAGLRYQHPIE